ncbi:MAG: hypothetical protein HC853_12550 [Anaerolineae bacterium]|nr:hypothetical protein [Anaerolineae bacterium]
MGYAASVIAFTLIGSRRLLRRAIGRLAGWDEWAQDAAFAFGQRFAGLNQLEYLPTRITQAVCDDFGLVGAALWYWNSTDQTYLLVAQQGKFEASPPRTIRLTKGDTSLDKPMSLDLQHTQTGLRWISSDFQESRVKALIPISVGDNHIGLLGLGSRTDEEMLHPRDLDIMQQIGQQCGLLLLNARQIEELQLLPRRVSEGQERERQKIAQELHDGPQQFLGGLAFNLASAQH